MTLRCGYSHYHLSKGAWALPAPQTYSLVPSSPRPYTSLNCNLACSRPHHYLPMTMCLTQYMLLHCPLPAALTLSLLHGLAPQVPLSFSPCYTQVSLLRELACTGPDARYVVVTRILPPPRSHSLRSSHLSRPHRNYRPQPSPRLFILCTPSYIAFSSAAQVTGFSRCPFPVCSTHFRVVSSELFCDIDYACRNLPLSVPNVAAAVFGWTYTGTMRPLQQ